MNYRSEDQLSAKWTGISKDFQNISLRIQLNKLVQQQKACRSLFLYKMTEKITNSNTHRLKKYARSENDIATEEKPI